MKTITILLLVSATATATLAQSTEDTIQWLKESSFDLQTTNPDVKIKGIPFEKILGDVQLVLAGEATHGTKEFAQMKHRLFRYLVEELDFRYFFIEADFAAGLAVDRYIRGEVGDPIEVLKGLRYFHIVNQEGLALIRWMKAFNETKSASEKIRFFGIDCQTSENAFALLKDFFLQVDPAFHKEISAMTLTDHRPARPTSFLDRKYPLLT